MPSPARSQGQARAPKQKKPRRTRSVGSPATSNASGRLTAVLEGYMNENDSFALVLAGRRSVLTDNTDIPDEPRRKSWWKNLSENSENLMEILEDDNVVETNNIMEDLNIEVLSQEQRNKNYTMDLPESSDSESINSIVLPQRKIFVPKDNQRQKKFAEIMGSRDILTKVNKNTTVIDKTINAGTKQLFQNNHRKKITFPAALLKISPDKTLGDKTKQIGTAEPVVQVRNIFGNRPGTKRKNIFADFIVSESEDEISDIQPKVFAFPKKSIPPRRGSSQSRGLREPSPASVTTDIEMEDWKHLPSSTMVEHQLEAMLEDVNSPVKRPRLSKLSETKESKTSNKSIANKSAANNTTITRSRSKVISEENEKESTLAHDKSQERQLESINKSKGNKSRNKSVIKNKSKTTTDEVMNESNSDKNTSKQANQSNKSTSKRTSALSKSPTITNDNDNDENIENEDKSDHCNNIDDQWEANPNQFNESNKINISQQEIDKGQEEVNENQDSTDERVDQSVDKAHETQEINESGEKEATGVDEQATNKSQEVVDGVEEVNEIQTEDPNDNETDDIQEAVDQNEEVNQIQETDNATENEVNQSQEAVNASENEVYQRQVDESEKAVDQNQEAVDQSQREQDATDNEVVDLSQEPEASENEDNNDEADESNVDQIQEQDESDNEVDQIQEQTDEDEANESQEAIDQSQEQDESDNEVDQIQDQADEDEANESQEAIDQSQEQDESDNEVDQIQEQTDEDEANESQEANDQSQEQDESDNEVDQIQDQADEDEANESQEAIDQSQEQDESDNEVDQIQDQADEDEANESQEAIDQSQEQDESDNEVDQIQEQSDEDEANESQEAIDPSEQDASDDEVEHSQENVEHEEQSDNDEQNESQEYESEQSDNEPILHYESEEMEVDNEEETPNKTNENANQDTNKNNQIENSPNISHDTTGRNRKQYLTPDRERKDSTKQNISLLTRNRKTSLRKTSIIKQSIVPSRDSIGLSDGATNSSAEGSSWDSHRTARKTIRQTFGRDMTIRKSLRTLVMEKSANRQTLAHKDVASETTVYPVANSTELPEMSHHMDDDDHQESTHEVSLRTRQTTLEAYLQKIKMDCLERKAKIEEAVRNSLESHAANPFKVPARPLFPRRPLKTVNKVKKQPILKDIPEEMIADMQYKPPKRFRPPNAPWITNRLYKFLETKLEPKYDYKARVRSEKLVDSIYQFTKEIRRQKVATTESVDVLKHELARLNIVKTHFEFYDFFHEFMPREVRVKVIPDVVNKIPLPRLGVFADIIVPQHSQG